MIRESKNRVKECLKTPIPMERKGSLPLLKLSQIRVIEAVDKETPSRFMGEIEKRLY
jgi:hypothetical protein